MEHGSDVDDDQARTAELVLANDAGQIRREGEGQRRCHNLLRLSPRRRSGGGGEQRGRGTCSRGPVRAQRPAYDPDHHRQQRGCDRAHSKGTPPVAARPGGGDPPADRDETTARQEALIASIQEPAMHRYRSRARGPAPAASTRRRSSGRARHVRWPNWRLSGLLENDREEEIEGERTRAGATDGPVTGEKRHDRITEADGSEPVQDRGEDVGSRQPRERGARRAMEGVDQESRPAIVDCQRVRSRIPSTRLAVSRISATMPAPRVSIPERTRP